MVDKILYSNNASSTLAATIVVSDVSILIAPGTGSLFPAASTSQKTFFYVVIEDSSGFYEVCKCTNVTGDVLTVTRGQDNTTPRAFGVGARVELRVVAASQKSFVQRDPDGFIELRGATVRGSQDNDTYELAIPADGSEPTFGGKPVVLREDDPVNPGDSYDSTYYFIPRGVVLMWSGTIAAIPTGWALCDGANGTPDLQDKFIMGAGITDPGTTGSENSKTLTEDEIPAHTHEVLVAVNATSDISGDHTHVLRNSRFGNTTTLVLDGGSGFGVSGNPSNSPQYSQLYMDSGGAHTHTFSGAADGFANPTGGGQAFDNRPSFYTLAFIMKL